jgi:hypothetical protein
MTTPIKIEEKYERNGRPALKRPDLKLPDGWKPPCDESHGYITTSDKSDSQPFFSPFQ